MELWKSVRRKFTWTKKVSNSKMEQPVCPPANIQSLPEELLLEIFSHLSLDDLCNTVPKVCMQWRRLHWDPQLYIMPRMIEAEGSIDDLFKCLHNSAYLASPYFDKIDVGKIIQKCLHTRHEVKPIEYNNLILLLSHLRKVNLIGNSASLWPDSSKNVVHLLNCCVQLKELKVCRNDCINIGNAELMSLCERLCGTLRVLFVDHFDWTLEVARAITKCQHLESLSIHESFGLSDECLLQIANISSLRHLSIQNCSLPSEHAWISMFSNKSLKDLTHLHLDGIVFSDKFGATIATNLINLKDLVISPYRTRGAGNKWLGSIIKGCNKLTCLEFTCLRYTPMTIVEDILMIPRYLPRLQTLYVALGMTLPPTNPKDVSSALKEEMPALDIQIYRYY